MDRTTIFIVDDDSSQRDALRSLFLSLGFSVRTFGDATSFLDTARNIGSGCVVLDVGLPDLDGLEVQQRLSQLGQELPIVFLTGQGDIPRSVRAIKAGAIDFLTKPVVTERLIEAVRAGLAAEKANHAEREELAELRRRYESLTPREREVMAGVVAGLLNKQIAAELGKTEATVKEQRGHVMAKMQASSLAELVKFAGRLGLSTELPVPPR